MDTQTNSPSPRKPANPADELFDDFDFKPLSKGLGFHHANKSEEAVKEATRVMTERAAPVRTAVRPQHPFEQHRMAQPNVEVQRDYVQNDLALFYGAKAEPQIIAESEVIEAPEATKALRFAAFVMDLIIIGGLTVGTLQTVALLTGLNIWREVFAFEPVSVTAFTMLFSCYFLLYFTLLEKFQGKSLGKDLIGLSLDSKHKTEMGVIFVRSLITLLGFLSLGLTNAVDLPGKITGTRVVRA